MAILLSLWGQATDPRGSMALIVFLVWLWLAIGILVVVLGMKIREADRLHEAGFFRDRPDP